MKENACTGFLNLLIETDTGKCFMQNDLLPYAGV